MKLGIIFIVILGAISIGYYIFSKYRANTYVYYMYFAKYMLINAVYDYNINQISVLHNFTNRIEYSEIMDFDQACNTKSLTWKDLIAKNRVEQLKPYLPENPEKWIREQMKKGKCNGYF